MLSMSEFPTTNGIMEGITSRLNQDSSTTAGSQEGWRQRESNTIALTLGSFIEFVFSLSVNVSCSHLVMLLQQVHLILEVDGALIHHPRSISAEWVDDFLDLQHCQWKVSKSLEMQKNTQQF